MPGEKRSQTHDAEGRETQQRSRKRERYTRIAWLVLLCNIQTARAVLPCMARETFRLEHRLTLPPKRVLQDEKGQVQRQPAL